MEFVFFWIAGAVVAAVIANSKGRSGFGYLVLSLMLSPLIGLLLVIGLPSLKKQEPTGAALAAPTPETHVKCPDCRELVLKDARKCKHCGTSLIPQTD